MQYHLFKGCDPRTEGRWIMFLYKDRETCIETWSYDIRYGMRVHKKDTADIPIEKRIYILGTTQGGQLPQLWKHEELNETDAYFMMFDT